VGARPIRTRKTKTDKNEKNDDRCRNNNSNRLLLLLEAYPTKATTKKPKTTTANKQTNKQKEVRIYTSRKKKNEAKTNLELLFSSELLFCSLVFYFFSLSSIVFCWSSFSSSVCRRNCWQSKNQKIAKVLLLCPSTGGPEIAMHLHFPFFLTTKQQETGSWKP